MHCDLVIRGGTILTLSPGWDVLAGDVHVHDGRLGWVGGSAVPAGRHYDVLDAEGCVVLPGLVQTHVHTCQTLARGRGVVVGYSSALPASIDRIAKWAKSAKGRGIVLVPVTAAAIRARSS